MSLYWGMYGTTPPKTMAPAATQETSWCSGTRSQPKPSASIASTETALSVSDVHLVQAPLRSLSPQADCHLHMAATILRSQPPSRPERGNKDKALTGAGPSKTHLCRTWKSRQSLGAQRSALTASEAQAPRGAPRGFPAQPRPVRRPGKLRRWRSAPGPLPASRTLGVHPAGLGEGRGTPSQSD